MKIQIFKLLQIPKVHQEDLLLFILSSVHTLCETSLVHNLILCHSGNNNVTNMRSGIEKQSEKVNLQETYFLFPSL